MAHDIKGLKVAVLATDGVEQIELTEPARALKEAGAVVTTVSPKAGTIQGMNHDERGDALPVGAALSSVKPEQFDALLLPGGVANPDYLRVDETAVAFVKHFVQAGKPIGAIVGPYKIRSVQYRAMAVVTNKTTQEAVRGFGQAPTNLAIERIMDEVANALGLDPLELRQRNMIRHDEFPVISGAD